MSFLTAVLTCFIASSALAESMPNVGRIYVPQTGATAVATQVGLDLIVTTASTVLPVRKNPDHQIHFIPHQRGIAEGDKASIVSGQVLAIDTGSDLALIRLEKSLREEPLHFSQNLIVSEPIAMVAMVKSPREVVVEPASWIQRMNGTELSVNLKFSPPMAGTPLFLVQDGKLRLAGLIVRGGNGGKSSLALTSQALTEFLNEHAKDTRSLQY